MFYLLNAFLLTWNVCPCLSRPSNERNAQLSDSTWSSFLTRFDTIFETHEDVKEAPTPQFYADFCGTKPFFSKYPTSKIVGGMDAMQGEFPWLAGLSLMSSGERVGRLMCGGTILTERAVLTAAHCLHLPPHRYQVLVGILYSSLEYQQDQQQKLIIEKYFKHPEFNSRTYKNDIALVLVRSPYGQGIWWSDYVLPVCLPTQSSDHLYQEKTVGTVVGWGTVEEGGRDQAKVLPRVDIKVQALQECQESYSATLVTDNQFCAGQESGGKDSCSGDSGGPFSIQDSRSGKHFLTGVVSFGVGCGRSQYPGVYTRVDKYLPWINNQLEVAQSSGQVIQDIEGQIDLLRIMERQVAQPFNIPSSPSFKSVCSGNSQVLICPHSSQVQVTHAFFGRDSSLDCPVSSFLPTDISPCSLPTALPDLQSYCQGRRLCTVVTAVKEDGGPFSSNPCPHKQPFVRLAYVCQQKDGSCAEVVKGNNFIQRRYGNLQVRGIEHKHWSPETEVQSEEFPDKKSAAWHSKPWERRHKSVETEKHSRINNHRLRFLVHDTKGNSKR